MSVREPTRGPPRARDRRPRRRHDGLGHRPARRPLGRPHAAARPAPRGARARRPSARGRPAKEAAKGRLSAEEADAAARAPASRSTADMDALAECELVIEAAPERLELKHELYGACPEIVGDECVLASNTSSLLVTAIAAAATHPERVVGMHFFNPAPLMRLLEVVAGELSERARPRARPRDGRGDGQDGDPRAGRPRLPRQPLQPPVRPGGAAPGCRSRSRTSRRSTGSCAWRAAFAWARSS